MDVRGMRGAGRGQAANAPRPAQAPGASVVLPAAVAAQAAAASAAASAAAAAAQDHFWLFKLPPFVIEEMARHKSGVAMAKLQMDHSRRNESGVPAMRLLLTNGSAVDIAPVASGAVPSSSSGSGGGVIIAADGTKLPAEYRAEPRKQQQAMVVFSEQPTGAPPAPSAATASSAALATAASRVKLEGSISMTVDVTPTDSPEYRALLRDRLMKSMTKAKATKRKPEDDDKFDARERRKAREEAERAYRHRDRRVRLHDDAILRLLHTEFDKKKFHTLKELLAATAQPEAALRELLPTIAEYHKSGEFRNHWSLLPQFQVKRDAQLHADAVNQKQAERDAWNKPVTTNYAVGQSANAANANAANAATATTTTPTNGSGSGGNAQGTAIAQPQTKPTPLFKREP